MLGHWTLDTAHWIGGRPARSAELLWEVRLHCGRHQHHVRQGPAPCLRAVLVGRLALDTFGAEWPAAVPDRVHVLVRGQGAPPAVDGGADMFLA